MYNILTMNEFQKVMREALVEFIRVCDEHHLRYYLVTGSALGAVRHQGFIPWDDDIDVAMPREDAMKLLKLKDEFRYPYFLQHYTTDKSYPYPYMKLRDSSTTYIENLMQFHPINHGIWIDIFIIDGMSKKETLTKKRKNAWLWFLFYIVYAANFWAKPTWKTFIPQLFLYVISLLLLPFKINNWLIKAIDRSMQKIKYDEARLVGAYLLWGGNKEAMPKHLYGKGTKAIFEGLEVVIPEYYDEYLTRRFGNYMALPPEDKRYGHHHAVGESTTIGYQDYNKKRSNVK